MKFEDEIRTKFESKDIKKKALMNVVYTGLWMEAQMIEILKPIGINDQHFNILRILRGRYPNNACPGEIKENLINKRGDLTRLLDKLVEMGYVSRETNHENRRMVDINITKDGLELLRLLDEKLDYQNVMLKKISESEAQQLTTILDKIRT